MSGIEHSKILKKVIKAIDEEGYEVYRIDKRDIPDAFYINNNGEAVAIEIETSRSPSPLELEEFNKTLVVQPEGKRIHSPEAYEKVKELRKKGLTLKEIQEKIEEELEEHLAMGTIHSWIKNKALPNFIIRTDEANRKIKKNKTP